MSKNFEDALKIRKPDHKINPLFIKRWSSRSMTGEAIDPEIFSSLLEAARWAPSSSNEQESRFIYASRNSPHWETFFSLLAEGNKPWCKFASHLVVIVSKTQFTKSGSANPVHEFDAGAAFENLVLEAADRNLVAHGMAGFDFQKAKVSLKVPDNFAVNAMIAIGVYDPTEKNLDEKTKGREVPSMRKPLSEVSSEGVFNFAG